MKKSSTAFLAAFIIVVIGVVAYGIYFNGEGGQASIWSRAKRAATKVAEKTITKGLLKVGVKIVAGPIGWGITLGTAAYGGYQIVFGEKPFTRRVIIADSETVGKMCNE